MFLKRLFLFLALSLLLIVFFHDLATAEEENTNQTSEKRPPPPKRIPPNQVQPGGGLDFARQACQNKSESLVALVPIENPVLTIQPYPSFLFYIPDVARAIQYGEFSLLTADEKSRIYTTAIIFQQTPGIIKIDLPTSPQYALEEGQLYHWYLTIYCQEQVNSSLDVNLNINGWIERVASTPERKLKVAMGMPDIWYDAIAQVAEDLIISPENPTLLARWLELLNQINLEHLVDVSLIDTTTQQLDSDSRF